MQLLDNAKRHPKVHEYIASETSDGTMDIVTGYFTIGALAFLSRITKEKVSAYRLVLGDIASRDTEGERPLNLLNEEISLESAIRLKGFAQEAVDFLRQDAVTAKTLEPNFCHAKLYLGRAANKKPKDSYYITGSSNLTEAGLGLRTTANVELNVASEGGVEHDAFCQWFDDLWSSPQAHSHKTVTGADGKERKQPFKEYLIEQISQIFREYTPKELYYKVLFELFGAGLMHDLENPEFSRQIGKLENTAIFRSLYEFQQKGVVGVIRMLQRYNGVVLADAVGLGKTWSALAVMKFFQMQQYEIVLICPKKLQHNWEQYLATRGSKFEQDKLDYHIRFHTDLNEALMNRYARAKLRHLQKGAVRRLFVIDESHNLRNDKSSRYKFFVEEVLKHNEGNKVMLLSATPINNTLNDVRNQFKLLVNGRNDGFAETLDVRNLEAAFRMATRVFKEWSAAGPASIGELIGKLPSHFLHLTDSLILARNRKWVQSQHAGLHFPKKEKPQNLFITPEYIGNYESFEELFKQFPPFLSGYQPAFYTKQAADVKKTQDEKQRQYFLAKMMYILLVKRLESCWASFHSTVQTIAAHHQNALDRILAYEKDKKDYELNADPQGQLFGADEEDELGARLDAYTLGKRSPIRLSDVDAAGMLKAYKADLKADIQAFQSLLSNLELFEEDIQQELETGSAKKSADTKLQKLMELIRAKQAAGRNGDNRKVLVFTTYTDTARYLYDQLSARGFVRVAMVSGGGALGGDAAGGSAASIENVLERFSPYTKLFREKDWEGWAPSADDLPLPQQYEEWKAWLRQTHPKEYSKIEAPVDILIATDVLSEGQNLQDCDTVVNYDIHWNPVRIIQRMGRIDRLGSPNVAIYGVNFWPSANINTYLKLQSRIEERMAAMKLAGAEVHHDLTDSFRQMAEDEDLERRQTERMMRHMQATWDDIEVSEETLGFDNLSLEPFRQDLAAELDAAKDKYRQMPRGVYTGFAAGKESGVTAPAIVALLGHPAKPPGATQHTHRTHELVCIDEAGKPLLANQKEVLDLLAAHKEAARDVPPDIDAADEAAVSKWSAALKAWMKTQASTETVADDGTKKETAGAASLDLLKKMQSGSVKAVEAVKSGEVSEGKWKAESFDLLAWFVVS